MKPLLTNDTRREILDKLRSGKCWPAVAAHYRAMLEADNNRRRRGDTWKGYAVLVLLILLGAAAENVS